MRHDVRVTQDGPLPDAEDRRSGLRGAGAGALGLGRRAADRVKDAANADGADRSGLATLLGVHALQAAGDALVAVALASTAFFQVSADAARGKIALYLLLTLLPFSLLVPVAGPLLDRFPHGRRYVLAATAGGRGLVAWTLAGSMAGLALYPQALAILILARAYGVARSAAVVRVRPPALGLVASNARLNVASVAGGGTAAAVGFAIASTPLGTPWVLRLATVLFSAAGVLALRLPDHVDDARTSVPATRFSLAGAPAEIRRSLVATVALRADVGLLTLGLAVLFKSGGVSSVVVALVLGGAVGGGLTGTVLASRLPPKRTARITAAALLAPAAACPVAVVTGSGLIQALAVLSVGMGASLGKYALDAALQGHVSATETGSAFAQSETGLQLGWALGGGLGLLLSLLDATALGYRGAVGSVFVVATLLPLVGLAVARRWAGPPRLP